MGYGKISFKYYNRPENRFVLVSRCICDDNTISWEARGLYLFLLSRREDLWGMSVEGLCKCGIAAKRDKMMRMIRELETAGYLKKERDRDPKTGQLGDMVYYVLVPDDAQAQIPNEPEESTTPSEPEADTQAGEQLTLEGAPVKEVSASKAKAAKTKAFEAEFEELWGLYPRKQGDKGRARKAYVAERKAGTTREQVEAGIKAYKAEVADTDRKYIAYGSSWFCGKRWHDYDEVAPATTGGDAGTEAIVTEIYKTAAASNYGSLSAGAKALISEADFEALQTIEAGSYCNEPQKYKEVIRGMIK